MQPRRRPSIGGAILASASSAPLSPHWHSDAAAAAAGAAVAELDGSARGLATQASSGPPAVRPRPYGSDAGNGSGRSSLDARYDPPSSPRWGGAAGGQDPNLPGQGGAGGAWNLVWASLSPQQLQYIELVQQLIVCEEALQSCDVL